MNEKKEKSERGCGVRSDRNYTRITIFFESVVKNTLENPLNLTENPLENSGKEFHFTVGHPDQAE